MNDSPPLVLENVGLTLPSAAGPVEILRDLSLTLGRGERVALVVAGCRPVGQAVREVFQECRYGLVRQGAPHACVQQGDVRERDAQIVMSRLVGEGRTDVHDGDPRDVGWASAGVGGRWRAVVGLVVRDTGRHFRISTSISVRIR